MSVMKYPINAKGGDPILTPEFEIITLNEINEIFLSSSVTEQKKLCKRLGISITSDSLLISICEKGRAYETPEQDRTKISEDETTHEINLKFLIENSDRKFPLPFKINFRQSTNQIFVNFYGEIISVNDKEVEMSVPLLGRGTVSLEARENDALAEPCCRGRFASFQQKVALLASLLAYFKVTRDEIEIFRAHLLKVSEKYFGRNDILNYTVDKAFSLTTLSYYEYIKNIYRAEDEENVPFMLQHFMDFAEPHPIYFVCLQEIFTPEELNKELYDISHDPKGPDKNPISLRIREIINKLIFLDETYMVKPYPGHLFKDYEGSDISIYRIEREINNNTITTVKSAFEKLGLTIADNKVTVKFSEKGKRYASEKNKNLVEKEEVEEVFQFTFDFQTATLDSLLRLKLYLDISPIDHVNFFGKIEIKKGFFFKTTVPLLGRGTVNLEGRLNDKHCCFSVGPQAASFQQKVALLYTCLVVLEVSEQDLRRFEYAVKKINNMFYGMHDIIDYTFKVANLQESGTFFEYMKANYIDFSKMPITLKTILTYNRLPPKYFESLIRIFTETELIEEEQRIQSIRMSNIVPKLVRKLSNIFVKINIF